MDSSQQHINNLTICLYVAGVAAVIALAWCAWLAYRIGYIRGRIDAYRSAADMIKIKKPCNLRSAPVDTSAQRKY